MALEGSIKDFSVSDILQLISVQKKGGILSLSNDKKNVSVSFVHGNIIHAFQEDEDEQLSNALIMAEKITIMQMRAGLRVIQKGTSLGEIFIKFAYITPEELKKWNQILTQETIFPVLSWESGTYRFDAEETSFHADCYLPVSVERILMEGARQKDEWPRLLSKIDSRDIVFEAIAPLVEGGDSLYTPEETMITQDTTNGNEMEMEEHAWLLKWIDGTRTVGQVINHAGVGAFPVYKCLVELLAIGRIKEKDQKAEKKRLSLISLGDIVSRSLFLNGLSIAAVFGMFVILFVPLLDGRPAILKTKTFSSEQFRQFTAVNQKDIILFSLNLYYLKHGHYPVTLDQLVEDGLFQTEQKGIALEGFQYRPDENGKNFHFFPIDDPHKTE